MTIGTNMSKKALSLVLCLMVALSCFTMLWSGYASAQAVDTRVTDPSTMDDWKNFFLGNNTENSGAIWTDKSVFTDAAAFDSAISMLDSDNNFLVALSAISAQTKIKGYSHLPTDTIFVLDVSDSLSNRSFKGEASLGAVQELVDSVNSAISTLQNKNRNNRVGVVLYSADDGAQSAQVLLPVGRYEHKDSAYLVKGEALAGGYLAETVKVNEGVVSSKGAIMPRAYKAVGGDSYIQSGVFAAMNEFLSVEDIVVSDGGFQEGSSRTPVMVLMTDGAPTVASSDYMNPAVYDMGDGNSPEDELASAIPFVTQLTAAYSKEKIKAHYGKDALVYTIGYREGDVSVVAPEESEITDAHWESYTLTSKGGVMQLAVKRSWVSSGWYGSGHWDTEYKPVYKSAGVVQENYTDKFFCADDGIRGAFMDAVDEIISKSMYYPTQVDSGNTDLDGYIEFIDDIGQYMEVKKVHGILLGDYLFTGNNIAKNFVGTGGALGTLENPSNLGDEMIRAVKARLEIEKTADAQKLVADAYKSGQLAYNPQTGEYSNYIGWYADKDGRYICHGTASDTVYPEGAEFYNESYGYLGEVFDGHSVSDMMYVSVQVHTRLSTRTSAVIFRVPASLIPVINYEVTLTGESVKEAGDITFGIDSKMDVDTDDDMAADKQISVSPIRLVYEVGLSDEINEFNVSEIVNSDYKHQRDGEYTFYASRWDVEDLNHEHPSVAKNTVAFYKPSEENERYYYTKNDTVYKKSGEEYIPYTSEESPANSKEPLYREFAVYETVNDDVTNNGRQHLHYAQIDRQVLGFARPDAKTAGADTRWYIPKGTIHRMVDNFHAGKGGFSDGSNTEVNENTTETIIYSHYLSIENNPEGDGYYVDVILGNNGRMSLRQAQGLKLTAGSDVTMLGREDIYEFAVKPVGETKPSGEYRLVVTDAQGGVSLQKISFEQGEVIVRIGPQQTAYLADLPEGGEFAVTEHISENDYAVTSVNGASQDEFNFTVKKNSLAKAEFMHSLVSGADSSAVVLCNKIEHPFGEEYVVPENLEFTYAVEYTDKNSQTHTEEVVLRPFETKHITDISLKSQVRISLVQAPAGFECDIQDSSKIIKTDKAQYYAAEITNTYTPAGISPQINLTGTKKLTGRPEGVWLESDEFTIKLQKFEHSRWEDATLSTEGTEKAVAVLTDKNRSYDFTAFMNAEVYESVGVYYYRVSEVFEEETSQGITYDKGVRWFDVSVTDKDMDGSLEIDNILSYGGTVVSMQDDGVWNISADFANTYAVAGGDTVTIILKNRVVDSNLVQSTEASPAGYEFGLYQGDRLVTIFSLTDEHGETGLTFTYGNFDIGKHIHYVIKLMPPEDRAENTEYTEQEYNIAVSVADNGAGGIHAELTAKESTSDDVVASGDEVVLEFVNIYNSKEEVTEPSDPEDTQPGSSEPEGTAPAPSGPQDATSSKDDSDKADVPAVPDTGFLSTMNIVLWGFTGVLLLLALICMIFVGRKK